jgi:hypothetical protein
MLVGIAVGMLVSTATDVGEAEGAAVGEAEAPD